MASDPSDQFVRSHRVSATSQRKATRHGTRCGGQVRAGTQLLQFPSTSYVTRNLDRHILALRLDSRTFLVTSARRIQRLSMPLSTDVKLPRTHTCLIFPDRCCRVWTARILVASSGWGRTRHRVVDHRALESTGLDSRSKFQPANRLSPPDDSAAVGQAVGLGSSWLSGVIVAVYVLGSLRGPIKQLG